MMNVDYSRENPALSLLKMRHVIFDELSFVRKGFKTNQKGLETEISVSINSDKDNMYRVTLGFVGEKAGEYVVRVRVTGYCEIDEDSAVKDELLKKNMVAILFPYVRSQLTLLTAQPETDPIILPALNINAMIDQAESVQN